MKSQILKPVPRVSVVIPTHNRAALLAETVESARGAGRDLEVVVVDDGSTDETPTVCAGLSDVRHLRFERSRGPAAARNAGVLASSGEFVAFLDDDDLRLPGTIDSQARALESAPEAALVYGRVLIGDPRRRLPTGQVVPARCPQGDVFWELLSSNFIQVPSVLVRRRSLVEAGLFNPEIRGVEDWDMWLRLSERAPFKASEEVVAVYRAGSASSGQVTSDRVYMYREMLRLQEAALRRGRARAGRPSERRYVRRRLRGRAYDVLVYEAAVALAAGDRAGARERLRLALRLRPFRAPAVGCLIRYLLAGTGRRRVETAAFTGEAAPQRAEGALTRR